MSTVNENKTPLSLGEYLNKELKGKNKTDFARRIGISRRQLYNILSNTRKLKPKVAKSLGEVLGQGPEFWLTVQHEYELYRLHVHQVEQH